jgi:hypothetical protein
VAGEPRAFGFHLVDARLHSVQHGAHRAGDRRYLPVVPVSPRDHRPGRGHRGDPVRRTVHPGVGAGERLNEHVTGRPFPSVRGRHEVLREALEVIRLLWQGGYQSYEGKHLQLEDARIFDLPETLPLIAVAASGLPSIAIAAESGDGLFATEPDADLVQSYRSAGSAASTGPCYGEVSLAWAPDADIAAQAVLETTRWALTGWKVMSELPNPANFAAATTTVTTDDIKAQFACGPDADRHLEVAQQFVDAGLITSSCRMPALTRTASSASSLTSCPSPSGPSPRAAPLNLRHCQTRGFRWPAPVRRGPP